MRGDNVEDALHIGWHDPREAPLPRPPVPTCAMHDGGTEWARPLRWPDTAVLALPVTAHKAIRLLRSAESRARRFPFAVAHCCAWEHCGRTGFAALEPTTEATPHAQAAQAARACPGHVRRS
jgi:hypothetical protein